jgi:hypothetical protein
VGVYAIANQAESIAAKVVKATVHDIVLIVVIFLG